MNCWYCGHEILPDAGTYWRESATWPPVRGDGDPVCRNCVLRMVFEDPSAGRMDQITQSLALDWFSMTSIRVGPPDPYGYHFFVRHQ